MKTTPDPIHAAQVAARRRGFHLAAGIAALAGIALAGPALPIGAALALAALVLAPEPVRWVRPRPAQPDLFPEVHK